MVQKQGKNKTLMVSTLTYVLGYVDYSSSLIIAARAKSILNEV